MTPTNMDPRFAAEIARMKQLIIEMNRRDGRWLLAIALAGLAVGVAAWFGLGELGPSVAAGGIGSMIGIVIWLGSIDPSAPKCPRCGFCWGAGESMTEWLEWKCCPGCGLRINDGGEADERP
jgi:hypothetical protein